MKQNEICKIHDHEKHLKLAEQKTDDAHVDHKIFISLSLYLLAERFIEIPLDPIRNSHKHSLYRLQAKRMNSI